MFGVMCISKKLSKIAELLNVRQSTIHREVKNRGFTYDNYDANKAHKHSIKKISLGNTHFIYSEEQKQLILSSIKTYSETKNWSPNALLLRFKIELPSIFSRSKSPISPHSCRVGQSECRLNQKPKPCQSVRLLRLQNVKPKAVVVLFGPILPVRRAQCVC